MLHRLGRSDEAVQHYQSCIHMRTAMFEADPDKPVVKQELARAEGMLGEFLFQLGQTDEALPHYLRSELQNPA